MAGAHSPGVARAAALAVVVAASLALGVLAVTSLPAARAAPTTRYAVPDDPACASLGSWTDSGCWALTSGGAGGAGPPSSDGTAIFDANSGNGGPGSNLMFVNDGDRVVVAQITFDGYTPQHIDTGIAIFGTLTVVDITVVSPSLSLWSPGISVFSDVGQPVAYLNYSGRISGLTAGGTGNLTLWSGDGSSNSNIGFYHYAGPNAVGTMQYVSARNARAIAPTIYCSPGCTNDTTAGRNVGIVFGPPPAAGSSTDCRTYPWYPECQASGARAGAPPQASDVAWAVILASLALEALAWPWKGRKRGVAARYVRWGGILATAAAVAFLAWQAGWVAI